MSQAKYATQKQTCHLLTDPISGKIIRKNQEKERKKERKKERICLCVSKAAVDLISIELAPDYLMTIVIRRPTWANTEKESGSFA